LWASWAGLSLAAVPLYGCRFVRPLGIIQRRNHKLNSTAQRFLQLLRQPETAASERPAHDAHNGRNGASAKLKVKSHP
jgi:hypothetical protein